MATTSFTVLRRFAGFAFTLMLFSLCLTGLATGQGSPLVTASSAAGLNHPTGWGTIQETAIDQAGDWLVVDNANGALYEFPVGGGAAITLGSATPTSSLGGSQNPVVAIDPGNNLYLGANWNNCIVMFPWNAAKGNWTGLNDGGANDLSPSNPTTTMCTNSGTNNEFEAWAQYGITDLTNSGIGYFQPWAVATGNNNNLIIGEQGGSAGANVLSLAVSGGWSNPKPAGWNWAPVAGTDLTARPIAVAQDPEGNVYFVEDSGGLPGVYEIPASATNGQYTSDCPTPKTAPFTGSSCLTRVDPNLPAVKGVITDAAGNLYISDLEVGVVEVPNPSGTPETSSAVLVSGVPAEGAVAIDSARNLMYVPTSQTQANGQADVAKIGFSYAELGSSPVGQTPSVGTNVVFGFNGSVTPANFVIAENGVSKPDFAITGGTCTTGVAYAEGKSCLENVSFTPNSVGNISAKLLMQELVPSGSTISVTAYSIATSSTTLTLTAANKFSSGEIVTFTDSNSKDPLYALNAQQLTVLPSGLSATQFEVQTSLVTAFTTTGSLPASATVQGSNYVTIASMVLHGTGLGANVQTSPALVSAIGSKLVTPTQVATDAAGNVYVADPGQGKVLMYAAGSGASSTPSSVGTGLTKPTGVAVDGSGDVFIADSGSVYEVPVGQSEVTGQAPGPNPTSQVTLASGLGATGLQLAADGLDNLYIADPSNGRVVKLSAVSASTASSLGQTEAFLTAGFTAPSAVAVDANNNLYVIDGQNLFELKGGIGAPTTLLSDLSGATGLAIDPSGAIYISSASGTSRIPYVNGAFAAATPVASTVSNTSSVALDRMANVYLTQSSGGAVTVVSFDGTLTLPTPATLTSSTDAFATITNAGNSALTVTGYTNTNPLNAQQPSYLQLPADFTGSDTSTGGCEAGSPIAAGATCEVEVTFAPGAGEQGAVTGTIGVISTAINAPTTIDATGTALPLANSATTVAGGAKAAEVINTPLTITVAPKSGAGTATGTVTITYETWNVVIPSSGSNAGIPTITPVLASATSSLTNGSASFTLSPVLAGPQAITVYYSGDRTYGRSTGTLSVNVAKSAITGIKLPKFPDSTDINLPFVPAGTGSGTVPYNGDETPFQYNFIMAVGTAAGVPTGQITVMDNVTACPPGTSATGIGAAACILPGYATPGGYSGVACPNLSGDGVLTIENAGTPTGAQASFPTSCLWFVPQGVSYSPVLYTHYISPVYSGDANFLSFTGPTSTLLQSVRGPLVQITQTGNAASLTVAPSLTVQAGSSTSMNLTLTSILGYGIAGLNAQLNASNFPVSLACDNLPPHTQCSFSYPNPDPVIPNAVDIPCPSGATTTQIANGSVQCTPGQVTVTFYTDVSAGTTTSQNARTASVTLAAIFGFGMVGLFFRRRAFEKGRLLLMVLLMIVGGALAVSITACNTTTLTPGASLSTPAGTYAVTITASEAGTLCSSSPGGPGDNCIVPGSGSTSNNGILVYGSQNQVSVPFYVNVTVQ